jgi:hypothetical protein
MGCLVRRIRLAWRRKLVRLPVYLVALLAAMYAAFLIVWDPPNDDGPLPTRGGVTEVSRIEPLYSRIVSRIAGRSVEVRCWSEEDWADRSDEVEAWTDGRWQLEDWSGYVSYDRERANLSPAVCRSLGQWAYERRWPENRWEAYSFAWSVKVLAHEAQHLRGIEGEAEADCYGLQAMPAVGAALGLDEKRARFLAEYAWHYIYPRAPGEYRSGECRDGGELDLRPDTLVWP